MCFCVSVSTQESKVKPWLCQVMWRANMLHLWGLWVQHDTHCLQHDKADEKGLLDSISPMCTLSQNGCGTILFSRKTDPALTTPPPPPANFPTGNKTSSDCAILLGECSCAVGARFASPGTELKNAGSVASPEISQTPSP